MKHGARCWLLMLALASVLLGGARPHPLHLGVLDLNYRPESGQLEVMIRLFRDDLADALSEQTGRRVALDLSNARDADLIDYVNQRLHLRSKGRPLALRYLGREASDDSEWLYFLADAPAPLRPLVVRNRLLFELFDDQKHIVHLSEGNRDRKSLRTDRKQPEGVFKER